MNNAEPIILRNPLKDRVKEAAILGATCIVTLICIIAFVYFIEHEKLTKEDIFIIGLFVSGAFLAFFLWCALSSLRHVIILYPDRIEWQALLNRHIVAKDDITAHDLTSDISSSHIVLEIQRANGRHFLKKIPLFRNTESVMRLKEWCTPLPTLDHIANQRLLESIKDISFFGKDPDAKVRHFKIWAYIILFVPAFLYFAYTFFGVPPSSITPDIPVSIDMLSLPFPGVQISILLLAVALYGLVVWKPHILSLQSAPYRHRIIISPYIILLLVLTLQMFIMAEASSRIFRSNLVIFSLSFHVGTLILATAIAACLLTVSRKRMGMNWKDLFFFVDILLAWFLALGIACSLNYLTKTPPLSTQRVEIIAIEPGGAFKFGPFSIAPYTAKTTPWRTPEATESTYLPLPHTAAEKLAPGDSACVSEYKGIWGIHWLESGLCPAGQ